MADTKKKPSTKKAVTDKVAAKTSTKKAVVKKNTAVKKKEVQAKKPVNDSKSVSVSESVKENKSDNWKVIAIIAGIVAIILIVLIGFLVFSSNDDTSNENKINTTNNENPGLISDKVSLIVIEDPTCASCQVDVFISQVKENLMPGLEATKYSYESSEGKAIIAQLGLKQLPAYLFGAEIAQRDDWATQLAGAFIEVSIEGENFYQLNPQFIPSKVMIEAPTVLPGAVVVGDVNAPVTIIEFSDYECPFCAIAEGNEALVAQFSAQSPGYVPPMPDVYKNYVDTGKVKVVFYNLPLVSIHKDAMAASNAAMCANEQGKWKDYHESLFLERDAWVGNSDVRSVFIGFAEDAGLDVAQFESCYDSSKYKSQIDKELQLAQEYGISGTPAFFVGKSFVSGAQDYNSFKALIDTELAK